MAISYFGDKEQSVLSNVRCRKIGKGYLVTTDYGSWAYLDDKEYKQLQSGSVTEPLQSILKKQGIILNEDNIDTFVSDYRKKSSYLFQGTSLHIVVPTLRCNMTCVYCHANAKAAKAKGCDMDKATAKKTVDFIFQSPSPAITIEFQGGEPLLRFDIVKYIVEYAEKKNLELKKNMQFSLVTNLTLMNEDILNFVISHNIGICTSLDGPKKLHNTNRQEYDKTAPWIKKILKKHTLNAMLLVTKHTLPYHKEIVDEYVKHGLPKIWIKPVNRLGYAQKNWKDVGMTAEEYLEFWKKALDRIVKVNRKRFLAENYTTIILRKILTKESVNFTDLESPCGAAIGQLAYNYNGSIHTCDEGRLYDIFRLGTVDDKYKDIVASTGTCGIVRASINDNPICEVCAYKPYCGLCPVCNYADNNTLIPKLPDRRCRILKGMFDHIFEKLLLDKEYRKVFFSWLKK